MKKKLLRSLAVILALLLCCSSSLALSGFSDVPRDFWASEQITQAASLGWVTGTGNGHFSPNETLTNAQFCKLMMEAFYPDVKKVYANAAWAQQNWWVLSCATMWEKGALEGTNLGLSYAKDSLWHTAAVQAGISRYDMAQMAANTLAKLNFSVSASEKKAAQDAISDWAEIPAPFREAVSVVYALGILTGYADGSFAGADGVTRAQAAVMLCRLAEHCGKLPKTGSAAPALPPTYPKDAQGNTPAAGVNAIHPRVNKRDAYPSRGGSSAPNANGYYTQAKVFLGSATLRYELLDMVNAARSAAGLATLHWVDFDEGEENTLMRATELLTLFAHQRPNGTTCLGGEVIGRGYESAEAVFAGWMTSPPHKEILLDPNALYLCAASADEGTSFWALTVYSGYSKELTQRSAGADYAWTP